MIIVSQDREETVNFNMVTNMFVLDDGHVRCMLSSGDDTFIARYKTKERAKEVLQEINARYESWQNLLAGQPQGACSPKYEMPLE